MVFKIISPDEITEGVGTGEEDQTLSSETVQY